MQPWERVRQQVNYRKMNDILLEIKGLKAGIEDKEILKGIDLTIPRGRYTL